MLPDGCGSPSRAPKLSLEDVRAMFELTHLLFTERTVPEVAQLMNCTEAQVASLLTLLGEVNVPVMQPTPSSYWVAAELPAFTPQESLAAGLALRFFVQYATQPSAYLAALQRLGTQWPELARAALLSRLHAAPQPHNPKFEQLAQAWLYGRALSFDYLREGARPQQVNEADIETLEIEPQHLNLELWAASRAAPPASPETGQGCSEAASNAQLYRLSRMRRLKLGQRRQQGSSVTLPLAPPLHATLRFTPHAAYRLLESRLSCMNEPEVQSDGALLVTIQSDPGAHTEARTLLSWILRWGAQVEVLSPPELREAWLAELRAALSMAERAPAPRPSNVVGH